MSLKSLAAEFLAIPIKEAGARHSKADVQILQTIHDHALSLGAACEPGEQIEAYAGAEAKPLDIIGDVIPLREGAVGQDGTAHLKLIAPGWGSSGYYSSAVLERDGPAIFKAGTKNFWNHQTSQEEAARPEGDLRDLASVLTEDARYDKEGAAGPGLYAKAKVFEEFRQPVDDLAKHIGMSIRATGTAKEGQAEGRRGPIIEKLTSGISVDYVTTPGAGGKILQLFEAAGAAKRLKESAIPKQEASMDAAEKEQFTKLQEATTKLTEQLASSNTANRKTQQKLARLEARGIVEAKLATVRLPDKIKLNLIERICPLAPITVEGELDAAALNTLVEARIKEAGEDIAALGGQFVAGMGSTDGEKLTEAQQKEAEAAREKEMSTTAGRYGFGSNRKVGARIFNEGREAFDPEYNSADSKEVA